MQETGDTVSKDVGDVNVDQYLFSDVFDSVSLGNSFCFSRRKGAQSILDINFYCNAQRQSKKLMR